jgi:hypothetical protein
MSSLTYGISNCCGLRELYGIQTVRTEHLINIFWATLWRHWNPYTYDYEDWNKQVLRTTDTHTVRPAHTFFTVATEVCNITHGDILKEYIEEYRLGKVWKSKPNYNKNSGHDVTMYVWTLDHKMVEKFVNGEDTRHPDIIKKDKPGKWANMTDALSAITAKRSQPTESVTVTSFGQLTMDDTIVESVPVRIS